MADTFSHVEDLRLKLEKVSLPQIVIALTDDQPRAEDLHRVCLEFLRSKHPGIEDIHLNGLEIESGILHAELSTVPMFDNGRFIWVRHADSVLKKIEANKTVLGYFERDLKNMASTKYILFQLDDKKLPGAFNFITKEAFIYEEKKLRESDLVSYLATRVRQMGYTMSLDSIKLLAEKSAWNSKGALRALDRLFNFTLHEKKIDIEDVEEVCYDLQGDLYFRLIDQLSERRIRSIHKTLLKQKLKDGSMLLGGFSKLFSDTLRYYYLKASGMAPKEIHQRIGLRVSHNFVFKKNEERFQKVFHNYTLNEISLILNQFIELDKKLKEHPPGEIHRTFLFMFVASLERQILVR